MFSHMIAEAIVQERRQMFDSEDWQRRAVLTALHRMRRREAERPRRAVRFWRPLVARAEGGVQ